MDFILCDILSGHVDPGEDEFTTALRETEEEAGYSAQDLIIYKEHQQIINYAVKGKPKRVVYWLAKLDPYKEPKLSEEHIELAWDTYPEAIKRANFTEFNQMLSKFDEIIRKNYVENN